MADFIQSYLNKKSLTTSTIKGKTLFQGGTVKLIDLNMEDEVATFVVQGSRLYYVYIYDFQSKKISSECNCAYDWGGICKHEIASLIFLEQRLGHSKKIGSTSRKSSKTHISRNTSTPYLMPDYLPLNEVDLEFHIDVNELRKLSYSSSVELAAYEDDTLTYDVVISEYSYYRNQSPKKVALQKEGEDLSIRCDCNTTVKKLCVHAYTALRFLQKNANPLALEILNPEFVLKNKNHISEQSGTPVENFNDYFEIGIFDGQIGVKSVGEGRGLLIGESLTSLDIKKQVNRRIENKLVNSLPVKVEELKDEPYLLCFAINFHEMRMYDMEESVNIIPFVAKKGKVTSLKSFAPYSTHTEVETSDRQALIVHKADELDSLLHEQEQADEHQKLIFYKLDELFDLLHEEENTFIKYDNREGDRVIKKGNVREARFSTTRVEAFLRLREEEYFYALDACLKLDDEVIILSDIDVEKAMMPYFVFYHKKQMYLFKNLEQALLLRENFILRPSLKAPKKSFEQFWEEIVLPVSKSFPIEIIESKNLKKKTIPLFPQSRQLYLSELEDYVLLQPMIQYTDGINQNIKDPNAILKRKKKRITEYVRDEGYETEFQDFLNDLHPHFHHQDHSAYHFLSYSNFIKGGWVFDAFEALQKADIEVFGVNDLKKLKVSPHKASISTHLSSGQDWFDVEIKVSFGNFEVKLSEVRKAVLKNERYVKLGDGKLGVLPEEWLEKLSKYFRAGETTREGVKISNLKFNLIDELFDEQDNEEIMREIHKKKKRLLSFTKIQNVKLPEGLKAELRDYQKEGVNWLNFLDEFRWGGILADDMGLGKTVQILTFLLQQVEKSNKPNLIVIPTSLLFNWENEINKFTPSLTTLFHYGPDRKKDSKLFKEYNLVITSYGIMVKDVELLKNTSFNYIVLDESQAIKNPGSLRYKAACLLKAKNRLTMTGTPIENNTFDLYAQINFLNPGFLGNQTFFRDQYSIPIDRDGDAERAGELQRLINPFMLRRTKEVVASELPPKIEDIIYCEMPPVQWKVYEGFRNKYRDMLLGKIEEEGMGKSKMYVLEGLMKLRQICDSPEILSDTEDYGTTSIKVQMLMQHIQEKTGNHKILVFSQFVKMLRVIEKELNKADIPYEYLDGQRNKNQRQKSVENFQNDDNCRVFLISLKAGGTGLNLTAADYVYIVDPWWNPAVENQAIDRCHRIGQDKHVIAYRMICKGTVEEKIMEYQAKKMKIASDIITTDESFMKQIGKNDIAELFG